MRKIFHCGSRSHTSAVKRPCTSRGSMTRTSARPRWFVQWARGRSTSTWEYPTADKMILTEAANTGQQRVSTSLYSMYGSRRLKTSETNENGTSSFMYDALGRLTTRRIRLA